jgi:imidazolonepropionase
MFKKSDRIWINVNIISMDSSINEPYGELCDHAIGVYQGRINAISPMKDFCKDGIIADIFDANGFCMTPGLIDSHTHIVFAGNRAKEFEMRLQGESYEEIARKGGGIVSTVGSTRNATTSELVDYSEPRLKALMTEGVTTIEIKSGYGLNIESELNMLRAAKKLASQHPVRVSTTLLGAHALPPEFENNADGYIDFVCDELIPAVAQEKLADAVDVFCESIAFSVEQCERVFLAASSYGLDVKAHVEQLSNSHGAEMAARYRALSVDHIEWLDEAGVKAISASGTVATLLPSAFYFLRDTKVPPISLLRNYDVPMAVATDLNPGSSPLASIRLAMNMACTLFRLTPEESLAGVTRNAAKALGLGSELGQLKVGMLADMILWDIDTPAELSYQFGVNQIVQRIFNGEVHNV